MLHISDAMVETAVTADEAQHVLREAFLAFGATHAAMQARIRTEAGGVKLSTLGAVIPGQDVAGAKVYTTIDGHFNFVVLLFSARDGRPLATFDAGALTRVRTAACSVLGAKALARPQASILGLFGAGTQGVEHAVQMTRAFGLSQILFHDPYAAPGTESRIAELTGVDVGSAEPDRIAATADIIVTASRSPHPLFSGESVKAGAFIAAIGSSLPTTRELDDALLARAKAIVVEWKPQTLQEAGDLLLADRNLRVTDKLVELADVFDKRTFRSTAEDIFVYKSVGVGLEDIALAGHVYKHIAAREKLPQP